MKNIYLKILFLNVVYFRYLLTVHEYGQGRLLSCHWLLFGVLVNRSNDYLCPCLYWCVSEGEEEWKVIKGKFLAINAVNMSCACPRSPKGLSPAAHLADGSADLILVRKCSRFDFLRYLVRHTNQDDQVCIPFDSIHQRCKYWYSHRTEIISIKQVCLFFVNLCILCDAISACVSWGKKIPLKTFYQSQLLGHSILSKFHFCHLNSFL